MALEPSVKPLAEHREVFDHIWWQLPERQNRTSSSWWFFILFPEGADGYGPRQLMFSVATRVGDRLRVNGIWAPGMDLDRPIEDGVDRFDAVSVGWYGDDERVHENLVRQPATATLSREGRLDAWADDDAGVRRGGEIAAATDRPLGLEARFVGEDGGAHFEAWGDLDATNTAPIEAMDVDTVAGGAHLVAWRRMRFEGEFDLPGGVESLEGLCYFHRACLNVPLFPWKWIWAFFPDGTAFSAFVPYLGPQLFRQGYRFFSSQALERATVPLRQSALWDSGSTEKLVEFDEASVTPILGADDHPDFAVRTSNGAGDNVEFLASTYGHARSYLDRPILRGATESQWTYNEYLFRTEDLNGQVGDEALGTETTGQGYGTLEYAWGLGV